MVEKQILVAVGNWVSFLRSKSPSTAEQSLISAKPGSKLSRSQRYSNLSCSDKEAYVGILASKSNYYSGTNNFIH